MKTTAIVAAAGLVGAVAADTAASSSIQWEQWSTTTTEKPVDPTTTASAIEWESWSSTSSAKVDPTTTASSIEWESWSSSSQKVDPTTAASSIEWESWSSTSQKVDPTSTSSAVQWESWSSEDPKPTETSTSTWAEWSSSSPVAETQTSTWAEWSTSETPVADTTTSTWAEWSSAATPVAETETQTWAEWESTSTTTVQSTYTLTKTIEPVAATSSAAETWAAWSSSSEVAATSTVAPAWSSAGWFGPQWPSAASGECVMNVVTSYGYPIWNPVPEATTTWAEWSASASSSVSASSSAETWAVWTETSTSDAATSTESSTWAVWTESASASSTASSTWAVWTSSASAPAASAPAQGGKGGAVLGGSGNKWSMTYSPYTAAGACKDSSAVSADIAKMASLGFSSVRVYSTDCKTLEYVGTAVRANNMKMILGVFISNTGINGAQGQVSDIVAWAQWDIVELVVIGNEAVFQGFCTASALATFIGSCKASFAGAGYTGAVTTTEPLAQWQSSGSDFCGVVDVVSANLYAFFNPQTTAEMAGDFIQSEIELLSKICPGKDAYVMESGWPSHGECNGAACPSPENQATAIKGIQQTSGAKVVFFSFEDESWKQPGQFGVEQHWGCSDVFSNSWSKW